MEQCCWRENIEITREGEIPRMEGEKSARWFKFWYEDVSAQGCGVSVQYENIMYFTPTFIPWTK